METKEGILMEIDESKLRPKEKQSQAAKYGVLGVQLGKDLYNTLNDYCQKGIIKTRLIRALVKAYLDQQNK